MFFVTQFHFSILAVPIFGGTDGREKTPAERNVEAMWKSKCYNASGVDVDVERILRLQKEYDSCMRNDSDYDKMEAEAFSTMFRDLTSNSNFNLTNQQKADLVAISRTYILDTPFSIPSKSTQ